MSVMFVVNVLLFLVLLLVGVTMFTPKHKTIRRTGTRPGGGEKLRAVSLLLIWLMAGGSAYAAQEPAHAGKFCSFRVVE